MAANSCGRHFRRFLLFSRGKHVWTFRYSSFNDQPFKPFLATCKALQTSCTCVSGDNSFKSYTEEDWKKHLSPEQYHVCREKGTEPPWSGGLLDNKQPGIYSCVCCEANLFDGSTKFDSESGWPSFWSAIEHEQTDEQKQLGLPNLSVDQIVDKSHGMVRVEVLCSQCGSHLGHVFSDGPKPTGLRYCINSTALKFKPHATE